ncbi:hypothetical protein [Parvibaculum sp. MBR-TMA-1.3b-4.2]|jgi:hypothetical protein
MSKVERISGADPRLPARAERQRSDGTRRLAPAPLDLNAEARGTSGRHPEAGRRAAAAPFLAQYVDQHWPWPRDAARKAVLRQRATSAYLEADGLPDRLEDEALNGRYQRKL